MKKTLLTLVRHGETEWNVNMRLQGMQNSKLTSLGKHQIELLADTLKYSFFDAIISSDLKRAMQTADVINKHHKLVIEKNENLRERNFGIFEGLTREEIQDKYSRAHKEYLERRDNYRIPQGESLNEFYNRVVNELNLVVTNNLGKRILIVSHGGILDCVMRMVFDYPLSSRRCFSISNAAINILSVIEGKWSIEQWGNVDHLKEIDPIDIHK
jgi:probable phosphoglycerate mutase